MRRFIYSKLAFMAIMSLVLITANAEETLTPATQKQLTCLAQNIYYEARSEEFDGKVAVAQVTLNRANSGKFPDTICGVVHQRTVRTVDNKTVCQFSWVCDPLARKVTVYAERWNECYNIARNVLIEGLRSDRLGNQAMYYHNTTVHPGWGLAKLEQIGQHIFYSSERISYKRK
jgi:N-acetylmuramoyl-L-alanine amidase